MNPESRTVCLLYKYLHDAQKLHTPKPIDYLIEPLAHKHDYTQYKILQMEEPKIDLSNQKLFVNVYPGAQRLKLVHFFLVENIVVVQTPVAYVFRGILGIL